MLYCYGTCDDVLWFTLVYHVKRGKNWDHIVIVVVVVVIMMMMMMDILLLLLLLLLLCYSLWDFYTSFNWWFITEFWATASFLRSPELFKVSELILITTVVWMVSILPLISSSPILQGLEDCSKGNNYNWYQRQLHLPQFICFCFSAPMLKSMLFIIIMIIIIQRMRENVKDCCNIYNDGDIRTGLLSLSSSSTSSSSLLLFTSADSIRKEFLHAPVCNRKLGLNANNRTFIWDDQDGLTDRRTKYIIPFDNFLWR